MMTGAILWLLVTFNYNVHPFHISVCEIEHNADEKALQITHHIFLDDLEETLNERYNTWMDIINPKDRNERDRMVKAYVTSNFIVEVDGRQKGLIYLGHEIEEDAIYCYITVPGIKKMKKIKITNTILMEKFDDQVNLVHVQYQGEIKSMKLVKSNISDSIIYTE